MKVRRIYSLTKKDLKATVREPAALFMILLFPVLLTLVFGVAFGAVGGSQSTAYQIGVVNMSEGAPYAEWGEYLIGNLSETEGLIVQPYVSNATAQADLIQGKIQAILIIPADFGESCYSFWQSPGNGSLWTNTTVPLYVDKGSLIAVGAIPAIVQQVLIKTILGTQSTLMSIPIQLGLPTLLQATTFSSFDYMAPGLFAFSAIFLIMIVSQSLTVEREKQLLSRIKTTPTTSGDLMTSKTISQMVTALIQVALVFVMAFVVGYRPLTDVAGIAFAFVIVAVFSLCCVGFGLIAAAISKSSGAATGISFVFILPLMMLGTYVSMGFSGIAQAAGRATPSFYVTDALTSLFLRGAPVTSPMILLDLAVVCFYSAAVLLIGIILFRKFERA